MGTLLREFSACRQDQSSSAPAFAFGVIPAVSLTPRVSELVRASLLATGGGDARDFECAGRPEIVRVKA
ncbi:hypothetical protein PC128_g23564 [Phytophthora cactorum]|nr:hypothetical protein PC120_g13732 [Phytophthora cactorum]KAG3148561.1 hypothetical protein PC128_g23564 [Phytophthora cactorum]KAG4054474.1 hypothetical protein PC123_g10427 [Phytophthora cactorum]